MSKLIQLLLKEMDLEAETTRKMLSRVPADKFDWKPHSKSMTVKELSAHIADLPSWVTMALTTDGLDFANNPYTTDDVRNAEDLLNYFERSFTSGRKHLEAASEKSFDETWILRNGSNILSESSRYEVLRLTFCQIVHHRAQLGVYLRLLNIPIPGSYGPSADEMGF